MKTPLESEPCGLDNNGVLLFNSAFKRLFKVAFLFYHLELISKTLKMDTKKFILKSDKILSSSEIDESFQLDFSISFYKSRSFVLRKQAQRGYALVFARSFPHSLQKTSLFLDFRV